MQISGSNKALQRKYGNKIKVLKNVVDGLVSISVADVFVGGGVHYDCRICITWKTDYLHFSNQFYVDDYLVETGLIQKTANSKQIVKLLHRIQFDNKFKIDQKNRAQRILNKMEDPADKLMKIVDRFVAFINQIFHKKMSGSPVENFKFAECSAKHRGLWSL